jgi:hypothetical protein
MENTVFPSTWSRQRCTPTADVGCALIFFPGGSTGSSVPLEISVPHRSFGRAYSRVGDGEEQEADTTTRSAAPKATVA